ncbi:abscisic acid receptor PYR1-like [Prosopis cineraria]|uniref:abscisic acid receptor PYR1-like n=1 Tax=Prosopis cineraria TaxID=364024 RepID=UPI00240FC05D|nr:abscisic acid receptor PYR1-like [Prosopis cineraria]
MEKGESFTSKLDSEINNPTQYHLTVPSGLTSNKFEGLKRSATEHQTYMVGPDHCSSLLAQRIHALPETAWSVVRRFDKPQAYKQFIKSCALKEGFRMTVGCTRDVNVLSGLPAATSTERLDILDDDRHVTGFSIIGGEHRLRNYRSVTTVHGFEDDGKIWTVVVESCMVDVPEGNTLLFADTVVKLNLQKLASVTEGMNRHGDGR